MYTNLFDILFLFIVLLNSFIPSENFLIEISVNYLSPKIYIKEIILFPVHLTLLTIQESKVETKPFTQQHRNFHRHKAICKFFLSLYLFPLYERLPKTYQVHLLIQSSSLELNLLLAQSHSMFVPIIHKK